MSTTTPTERAWLLVARREVLTKLTDRAFLLGTAITILFVAGFIGYQAVLEGTTQTYTVAATAEARPTAQALVTGVPELDDSVKVELLEVGTDDAGVAAVENEEADVLLRPADNGWSLVATKEVPSDLATLAETVVGQLVLEQNAAAAGTSITDLQRGSEVGATLLDGDAERQDFAEGMGFALALLFYLATVMFGYTLSGSVVEEKSNRIVEIIATKIAVRQLLIGKIAGNTLLAIGQTALIVAIGLVGISFTDYAQFLPAISEGVGWFVAFFVVGFSFIACWWAVAGALASRAEDLQSTATPLSFLMMAVFFSAFLLDGTALTVASYVPPFSTVLMPVRLLGGDALWWEPVLSILVLLAAMAATVVLAERIYRRALLQTQGRVSLRQAWSTSD